jgi:hypothetical protein
MSWPAGVSLIESLDELRELLGPHHLENLEQGIEDYQLMSLVTRASNEVRASIKGIDPGKLANAADYKPAVAAHVHAELVRQGFVSLPEGLEMPVSPFDWSKPRLIEVEPRLTQGDRPPRMGSSFPRARNINHSHF